MSRMSRFVWICLAFAAVHAATAATVRTASEGFVTNRIAAAVAPLATTNAVAAAISAAVAPLATTNAVAAAISTAVAETTAATNAVLLAVNADLQSATNATLTAAKSYSDENKQSVITSMQTLQEMIIAVGDTVEKKAGTVATNTVNDLVTKEFVESLGISSEETDPVWSAEKSAYATTNDVEAMIREMSLGGIWDETLQVWWTPRMSNGSLTYMATTNVNLNAED